MEGLNSKIECWKDIFEWTREFYFNFFMKSGVATSHWSFDEVSRDGGSPVEASVHEQYWNQVNWSPDETWKAVSIVVDETIGIEAKEILAEISQRNIAEIDVDQVGKGIVVIELNVVETPFN